METALKMTHYNSAFPSVCRSTTACRVVTTLLLAALLLIPVVSHAQILRGHVTEQDTGGPIAAVMILLLDGSGAQRAATFTDRDGAYQLIAPQAGDYTLRVLRIGYESWESAPVRVVVGASYDVPLVMPVRAIQLAGLEVVESESSCSGTLEEGTRLVAIWSEVKKVLTAAQWTAGQQRYRYTIRTYDRDLNATGKRILREQSQSQTGNFVKPFWTLPPEELSERGYFELSPQAGRYYAPDAEAVLSEFFIEDHCFAVQARTDAEGRHLVGLAFAPIPDRRDLGEVEGVLWLDEATAELRELEFTYVNFPEAFEGQDLIGGRIAFQRLPSGAWIVRDWSIRVPELAQERSMRFPIQTLVLQRLREVGGEVLEVWSLAGELVHHAPLAALLGTVYDSVAGEPLADATVAIAGTAYGTQSNDDGRFTIEAPLSGEYTVTVSHPRIDSLGIRVTNPMLFERSAVHTIRLAVPTMADIVAEFCGDALDPRERVVTGMVRDGASGAPVEGATVRLRWSEISVEGQRIRTQPRDATLTTDAEGRYAVCRLPIEHAVALRTEHTDRVSRVVALRFHDRGAELDGTTVPTDRPVWRVDLTLSFATAAFRGRVVTEEASQPLQGATVELLGEPGYAETADDGRFEVAGALAGSARIRVRVVGYKPQELVETLVAHETTDLGDVVLQPLPPELEPVEVTAEAACRHHRLVREGYYERRARGIGVFVDAEDIEKWQPKAASDVMRRLPSVRIAYIGFVEGHRGLWDIEMRRKLPGAELCPPLLYLDGIQLGTSAEYDLDTVFLIDRVAGMELYSSPAQIPPRFNATGSWCGIIVVWMK